MFADPGGVFEYLVEQVEVQDLRFLDDSGHTTQFLHHQSLPRFEADADLCTHLFEEEIDLVRADLSQLFGVSCHLLRFLHHLHVDLSGEDVHVDALALFGVDLLLVEQLDVPLWGVRHLPDEDGYLRPNPQQLGILLLIIE
jgi:hypothetical protein